MEELMRFFGMYAPLPRVSVLLCTAKLEFALVGAVEFGSNIWLDINFKNIINIEDNVLLAGYISTYFHIHLSCTVMNKRGFLPWLSRRALE